MKTTQLRHLAEVWTSSVDKHTVDGEVSVQLCNYTDAYKKDRVRPGPDLMRATATLDEVRRNRLRIGDSVFTKDSEDPQDIGISAYVDGEAEDFVCGYHLAIARPALSTHPRYLTWALRSRPVLDHFGNRAAGISRYGIGLSDLRAAPIPDLHPEEQRRIADFLDDRVSRIDRIIAARRDQISSLQEQRQSVAERLVWQGLDPTEPSQRVIEPGLPSPERWPTRPNRYLLREVAELSLAGDEELLSVSHLTGVTPRSEKSVTMFMADSLVGYKIVRPDDLVINTLWAWMGALGVSKDEGIVSPAYGVYRPIDREVFHPAYFDEVYRSSAYVCEMTRHSKGVWTSRLRLYPDSFLALNVMVPSMAEQQQIVREIERAVGENGAHAELLAHSIDLLTEYKSSVITAAVSGELDVTTAGSNIPG